MNKCKMIKIINKNNLPFTLKNRLGELLLKMNNNFKRNNNIINLIVMRYKENKNMKNESVWYKIFIKNYITKEEVAHRKKRNNCIYLVEKIITYPIKFPRKNLL